MDKRTIVDVLQRLAFASGLLDRPQASAWANAAWALRQLPGEPADYLERGELRAQRGVGPAVIRVVETVLAGELPDGLSDMESQIPEGLFELRRVSGIGPKKIRRLWQELEITSLAELEYACQENRLLDLKGFGRKTQDKIADSVRRLRTFEGWFRRDHAGRVGQQLQAALQDAGATRALVTGDLRRGCELVDTVELVALLPAALTAEAACQALADLGEFFASPADDDALATLDGECEGVPVVVHLVSAAAAFGVGAVWTTGSRNHLRVLRQRAAERGLRLNASGLGRNGAAIPAPEEADVYEALGLAPVPAEQREADTVLYEAGSSPPRLVRRSDLVGALHNHTVASDGLNTLREMRDAAAEHGLSYLGVSEHSVTAFYAGGLHPQPLLAQRAEIEALNAEPNQTCALLAGVESDILADGDLDYAPDVLAQLEFVVASIHQRHGHGHGDMTRRMVAAGSNPWTTLVGHPTGRLLLGRPPTEFDMAAFLDACADNGCAVELNASPHRLDLNVEHLQMARERGLKISIGADAHSVRALANLDYGIAIARRAGLTPADVLNCLPLDALRSWLDARRARAAA